MTSEELQQGWIVCSCGRYAYVTSAAVLQKIEPGYNGELCRACGMWICAVEKLPETTQKQL